MVFISMGTWEPEKREEVQNRAQQGITVVEGVKLIGAWSDISGGRSFGLFETDDPKLLMAQNQRWNDIMDIEIVPVVQLEEALKVIASG